MGKLLPLIAELVLCEPIGGWGLRPRQRAARCWSSAGDAAYHSFRIEGCPQKRHRRRDSEPTAQQVLFTRQLSAVHNVSKQKTRHVL